MHKTPHLWYATRQEDSEKLKKFSYRQLYMQPAVLLCHQIVLYMILGRCHHVQIPLNPTCVIVNDVVFYSGDQVFPGSKTSAIVHLAL